MWKLILLRLLKAIPVLLVIATLTFFMLRFTKGGPFDREKPIKDEKIRKQLLAHYGMDKPLSRQYLDFMGNLVQGDLGPSFKHQGRRVNKIIAEPSLVRRNWDFGQFPWRWRWVSPRALSLRLNPTVSLTIFPCPWP